MKKNISKLFLAGFLIIGFLILPISGLKALTPTTEDPIPSGTSPFSLENFLTVLSQWVFWVVIIIAFIFIVLAGYTFITAGGDPVKITKAKDMLIYSLIGVAIAFLAWSLISWVKGFVGA